MFPFTRVPFQVPIFDPHLSELATTNPTTMQEPAAGSDLPKRRQVLELEEKMLVRRLEKQALGSWPEKLPELRRSSIC